MDAGWTCIERNKTMSQKERTTTQDTMSFRPRRGRQKEDFELLCFVLDLKASEVLRMAIDDLIEKHQVKMDEVRPLYEAAQGALAQARASLESPSWCKTGGKMQPIVDAAEREQDA